MAERAVVFRSSRCERAGVHGGRDGQAEARGLGQGQRRCELLGVAQDGEAGPGGDQGAEQVTAGRGHAQGRDQQAGHGSHAQAGPAALAGGEQQVADQRDDHHGQPQRRPRPAVGPGDRLRVPGPPSISRLPNAPNGVSARAANAATLAGSA